MTFNYGKLISKELSDYIKKYTTKNEMREVADLDIVECSYSSLRDAAYRYNPLVNEKIGKALIELMKVAIQNSTKESIASKRDTKKFSKMLVDPKGNIVIGN